MKIAFEENIAAPAATSRYPMIRLRRSMGALYTILEPPQATAFPGNFMRGPH
jgi:hypothetical protein